MEIEWKWNSTRCQIFFKKFSARARGWINDTDNGKNDKQSVFFFWAPTWRVWHESYPGGLRNDDVVADSRRSTKWNPSTETLSQCVCLTNPQQTKSPPLVTTPHHQLWTFLSKPVWNFPLNYWFSWLDDDIVDFVVGIRLKDTWREHAIGLVTVFHCRFRSSHILNKVLSGI